VIWTEVVAEDGKDYLVCGVEFSSPSKELKMLIGQYLFQFSEQATTAELLADGLPVKTAAAGVTIDYVRTEEDYREVLKLRARCYTWVTGGDESRYLEMADEFDARSRIVIARRNGVAVGSFRLVFHNVDDQLEQQKHAILPEDFPRNDELLEVTRICTDPSYRGTDLFYVIAKHAIIGVLQAGRRWGVSACTDSLWPLYEKMGFKKIGVSYTVPGHGVEVHTIICDVPARVKGIGIHPIVWNLLGIDLVPFVLQSNLLTLTSADRIRMTLLRTLKPLALMLASRFSVRRPKTKVEQNTNETVVSQDKKVA
jgi:predicted GNAT family N-acyltransferase